MKFIIAVAWLASTSPILAASGESTAKVTVLESLLTAWPQKTDRKGPSTPTKLNRSHSIAIKITHESMVITTVSD